MNTKYFLVVSELAAWEVDGEEVDNGPPEGKYGTAWIVVRAENAREALRAGRDVLWERVPGDQRGAVTQEEAIDLYEVTQ